MPLEAEPQKRAAAFLPQADGAAGGGVLRDGDGAGGQLRHGLQPLERIDVRTVSEADGLV